MNKNMLGIVNSFYQTLYLVPYGPLTHKYAPFAKENDIVGIFLTTEDNEDKQDESFD